MMIRKIWRFLWYQNRNNFEKNEKRKDQAPLSFKIKYVYIWYGRLKYCISLNLDTALYIKEIKQNKNKNKTKIKRYTARVLFKTNAIAL